ncbi:proline--tRNA ligase [Candidatus Woesearchaeota archaeon]|nr:proline--tRNA ligase [Candidatus Woesearchaeota archaeon]
MQKKDLKGITIKKDDDFSEWYSQLLQKADLIEYTDVSGCYILKPRSYAIWEIVQTYLDKKFKDSGVKNVYFPLFIPEHLLTKEAKHFAGFTPEVAWVTEAGSTKLSERLAIRPTSETIMYNAYAKWIRSYKDLPLRLNQWCNVVRWEFKHSTPFLRSREFLWQEGHSAFSTKQEAEKEALEMLNYYAETYEDMYAVPVIKGRKSKKEKFAGAEYTLSIETLLPNGKAIQCATSHYLGQNFSEAFNIRFIDKDEKTKLVHQNSWGFSTRSIGIMLMMHSDDKGLVIPPNVAENKLVIVPILIDKEKEKILKACNDVAKLLKEFNPIIDDREEYTPGWKFNDWELKGIPLRIEIGPKDIAKDSVVVVTRHDNKKSSVKIKSLKNEVGISLEKMQKDLFEKAKKYIKNNIIVVNNWKEFEKAVKEKKLVKANWCDTMNCEEDIKNKSDGAKSLVIPLDEPELKGKRCFNCGKEASFVCYFGKSY